MPGHEIAVGAPGGQPGNNGRGYAHPDPPAREHDLSAPDAAGSLACGQDAQRWREAARLRGEHAGWVIVWLAPAAEFRAYRRLPGARRDTTVSAATADGLAVAMLQAEQAASPSRGHGQGQK